MVLGTPDLRERLAEWWEEVWSLAHWVRNVLLWPLLLWRRGRDRPVPWALTAGVVLGFLLLFGRETWRWATDDPYVGPWDRFFAELSYDPEPGAASDR